uniref:Uncharacterized protein n=1 Tax=Lotharella globosa TaxID=91324 RepID=A0A7S3ZAT8_9EUKA
MIASGCACACCRFQYSRTMCYYSIQMGAMTAGEHAYRSIHTQRLKMKLGSNCLWLGRQNANAEAAYSSYLDGVSLNFVASADEAEFILLQGTDNIGNGSERVQTLSYDYEASGEVKNELHDLLTLAARCRLPMHCLNPDRVAVKPNGMLHFMQGSLAAHYQRYLDAELGNDGKDLISLYGKPTKEAFAHCLAEFKKSGIPSERVVMIGDSLEHDIMGAANGGIDSVLVAATGIHKFSVMTTSYTVYAWSAAIVSVLSAGLGLQASKKTRGLPGLAVISFAGICIALASVSLLGMPEEDPVSPLTRKIDTCKLRRLCNKFHAHPNYVLKQFKW